LYKNQNLQHQVPANALDNQKHTIVQKMVTFVDERFENCQTQSIFLACQVSYTKNWPDRDDLLIHYGDQEINQLWQHFEMILQNAGVEVEEAINQWQ
jgi:hypothetical protein